MKDAHDSQSALPVDFRLAWGRSFCDIFAFYSPESAMRRPTRPKRLYIDFDGFFASCEEQADPGLHGRPVGVIPFAGARNSCVIRRERCGQAVRRHDRDRDRRSPPAVPPG